MINFNFGAVLKPLVSLAGTITEVSPSQSLPVVVAGTGVIAYLRQVPTTGFNITAPNRTTSLILDPAGTLASGTVTMPPTPLDGQVFAILSSQTITALTVAPNTGQSLYGAPGTILANGCVSWEYCISNTTWYRSR